MNVGYVVAAVLVLVGVIFIGQGLGYIGGSRMTGSSFWAAVGVLLLIAAGIAVWWTRRRIATR